MAHLKAFRQRWLAAAAQGGLGDNSGVQQPVIAALLSQQQPQSSSLSCSTEAKQAGTAFAQNQSGQAQQPQRQANGAALLPRKRFLENATTAAAQQQDSPAKKQRQGDRPLGKAGSNGAGDEAVSGSAAVAEPSQQQQMKLKAEPGRLNGEGKPRLDSKVSSTPAAQPAAKPIKREGLACGSDSKPAKPVTAAGQSSKPSLEKPAARRVSAEKPLSERPMKKESVPAAAAPPVRTAERPVKNEAAEEHGKAKPGVRVLSKKPADALATGTKQTVKKEAAPAAPKQAAAVASVKAGRLKAEANGRPVKSAAAAAKQPAAVAGKATVVGVKVEAQQEHAGSNPSSMHREGGGSEPRHQQQQVTSPARPAAVKAEAAAGVETSSSSLGTPLELLLAPADTPQPVGHVVVPLYAGHNELWEAVQARCSGRLPSGQQARLLYQDTDGDWLLLKPDAPWHLFTRSVRKLVVSSVQRQQVQQQEAH